MKKQFAFFLALLLMLGMTSALASSVNYVGGAEAFIFLPGSEYAHTDLFENFKNCVPGDVRTQEIAVRNTTNGMVRIYMKAEPVHPSDRDFLNQLHMTVHCEDQSIFDAAPSRRAQLTEYVLLGTFKGKGQTSLDVELTIPKELGNEYMGEIGIVPWTFMVEEIPDDDTPHTGDWYESSTWLAIAGALLAIIIILLAVKRRKAQQD